MNHQANIERIASQSGCDWWFYDHNDSWSNCIAVDKNDPHLDAYLESRRSYVEEHNICEYLITTVEHEDGDFYIFCLSKEDQK